MAGQFPIYRTQKTLPGQGPNVTGRVNFDTGAGQMAAAIGRMGEAMFQVGGQMWEVQAAKQFSEQRLDTTREANKLMAQIEANHDPEAIAEYTNQFYEYARNKEIPNGLAARRYQEWLNLSMPEIESAIDAKKRKITVDDWTAHGLELTAEAERTGNSSAIEAYYKDGVRAGMVDSATVTQRLIPLRRHIANETVFSSAIRTADKETAYKTVEESNLSDEDKAKMYNRLDSYWWGRTKQETDNKYVETLKIYDDFTKRLLTGNLTYDDVESSPLKDTTTKKDKTKWQGYILGSFGKSPLNTTPDGYDTIANTVMQFGQGQLSKQQAYDNILSARYTTQGVTDNDSKWALEKLERPYPKHIISDLKSTMAANTQQIGGWWESTANRKRSLQINLDLLRWVDNEIANKKTPTAKEMYQRSAVLMAGQNIVEQPQPLDSPYPEYPDAYQDNGIWYIWRDRKRYRIEP